MAVVDRFGFNPKSVDDVKRNKLTSWRFFKPILFLLHLLYILNNFIFEVHHFDIVDVSNRK